MKMNFCQISQYLAKDHPYVFFSTVLCGAPQSSTLVHFVKRNKCLRWMSYVLLILFYFLLVFTVLHVCARNKRELWTSVRSVDFLTRVDTVTVYFPFYVSCFIVNLQSVCIMCSFTSTVPLVGLIPAVFSPVSNPYYLVYLSHQFLSVVDNSLCIFPVIQSFMISSVNKPHALSQQSGV